MSFLFSYEGVVGATTNAGRALHWVPSSRSPTAQRSVARTSGASLPSHAVRAPPPRPLSSHPHKSALLLLSIKHFGDTKPTSLSFSFISTEDDDSSSEKKKLAIIIGLSVAGGLFVLAVCATIIFVVVKRLQRSKGYVAINETA